MKQTEIDAYSKIPQPPRDQMGFIADLTSPMRDYFAPGLGCPAGSNEDCLKNGYCLTAEFDEPSWNVETAVASLRRVLHDKGIPAQAGGYPIRLVKAGGFSHEEYEVVSTAAEAVLRFGDSEGCRRAIYFYEDRLRECEGAAASPGIWRRKPYVKHRVSRCFFGPTYRPPFFIDELTNDVDYYPETYLDKLAHEGINGLWLSMYFKDLPSSIFPGRGQDAERRFEKLRRTVEKCGRYGIRIYVFLSEPKRWGNSDYSVPFQDAAGHPEVVGEHMGDFHTFCTSSETGKRYLEESVTRIFSAVPGLGGIINIMFGEDNGSCAARLLYTGGTGCPRCRELGARKVLQDTARLMCAAMKRVAPEAEYIAWFYAPTQRDGSELSQRLLSIAEGWPEECGLMFNFESGGTIRQLGADRTVFDYSLAFVGPSKLFAGIAPKVPKMGAKLQVGCSHEDASVPFIPVPLNLYDKYRTLHDHQVYAVMQCWYFGNYPGLMNTAAGKLSFEPFTPSGDEFLLELARPDWKSCAPQVVEAWKLFSRSYRQFPGNIAFEWYGPLHYSLSWPWHLFPVDQPISPSWLLEHFPEVSGDRVGECVGYHHNLKEALELVTGMCQDWKHGLELMKPLRKSFAHDPNRLADIALAEAVGLQMRSTRNMLEFYVLREDMLYFRHDHLKRMAELVQDEIQATEAMTALCQQDPRLGYHSEAEGYLFFPEKLEARKRLLEELLAEDFPRFDLKADWLDEFTGARTTGPTAYCEVRGAGEPELQPCGESGVSWGASYDADFLYIQVKKGAGQSIHVEIEPCRCHPALSFFITPESALNWNSFYHREVYHPELTIDGDVVTVAVPQKIFAGYRKEGFPMRINVSAGSQSWVTREPWPYRLYQADENPACLGWLVFK